jgi:choline dehydrogenase-like flavoprotein
MSAHAIRVDPQAASPPPVVPGYDVVIGGAGSADCLLASCVTEDRVLRVLLIEAGSAERHTWLRIPVCVSRIAGLLMRSGIRPADDLAAAGIPVVHPSDLVGRNQHAHPSISLAV